MKNRSYDVNGKSNLGYVDHENNTSPEGVFSKKQGINMFIVKIVSDAIFYLARIIRNKAKYEPNISFQA